MGRDFTKVGGKAFVLSGICGELALKIATDGLVTRPFVPFEFFEIVAALQAIVRGLVRQKITSRQESSPALLAAVLCGTPAH